MWNSRLDETEAGVKIATRNIDNLRYTDDTTLMAESERGTKELLDEGEREEWKCWVEINIQKTKIVSSSPTTSWQIKRETVETVTDFFCSPKSLWMVTAAVKLKDACFLEKLW